MIFMGCTMRSSKEKEFHCDYAFPECVPDASVTAFSEVMAIAQAFHIRDVTDQ